MELRERILGAQDIDETLMEVPEWDNATILLRGMTGKQRMQFFDPNSSREREFMYSDLLINLLLDPDTRKPAFDIADRDALSEKSGAVLERVSKEIIRLSGGSDDEAEAEVDTDPT